MKRGPRTTIFMTPFILSKCPYGKNPISLYSRTSLSQSAIDADVILGSWNIMSVVFPT